MYVYIYIMYIYFSWLNKCLWSMSSPWVLLVHAKDFWDFSTLMYRLCSVLFNPTVNKCSPLPNLCQHLLSVDLRQSDWNETKLIVLICIFQINNYIGHWQLLFHVLRTLYSIINLILWGICLCIFLIHRFLSFTQTHTHIRLIFVRYLDTYIFMKKDSHYLWKHTKLCVNQVSVDSSKHMVKLMALVKI